MPATRRKPEPVIDPNDRYILAATIYAEARGEGTRGMRAVGDVILNRLTFQHEGAKTVAQVALKAGQFACWRVHSRHALDKRKLDALDPVTDDGRAWAEAQKIAEHLLNVHLKGWAHLNEVGPAVYFAENTVAPLHGWVKTVRIGKHTFYRAEPVDAHTG